MLKLIAKLIRINPSTRYKYGSWLRAIVSLISSKTSLKKRINYLKIILSSILNLNKSHGNPLFLTIEPTNICNCKCTICETGLGILERQKEFLTFDKFKNIIDQFDMYLERLNFYFMGEPFLNKDAYQMLNYSANKGLWVSVCTNGDFVDSHALINTGITEINFQIAGMTKEIHSIYRIGSDLDVVLANLGETIRFRNESGTNKTKIYLGYILMKHNEHQLNEFISYAKKIGVDGFNVIDTCVRTVSQANELLPTDKKHWIYNEKNLAKGMLTPKILQKNYCGWLYASTTIMVNGDVVPCCRDPKGKHVLGNVFKEHILEIWNNSKYQAFRKNATKKGNLFGLCSLCSGYEIPTLLSK